MNGRSPSGTTGFGIVEVSGRSRVPSPPARIRACKVLLAPPDALVGQTRRPDRVWIEEVASVEQELASHAARHFGPIELGEVTPLGYQHNRIAALYAIEGGRAELDSRNQASGCIFGNGVEGAHLCAFGL